MDQNLDTLHPLQIFELSEHNWEGNPGFEPSQWRAYTEVDAVPKGRVPVRLTFVRTAIGVGEFGRTSVRFCFLSTSDVGDDLR